jgi:hypothetical protein
MIQDTRQAKGLCTVDEFRLYRDSLSKGRLEQLSPPELQSRLRRARSLRDKYRGVYRRQRGGARGKLSDRRVREVPAHSRTFQKAELFEEAVERFDARLRDLETERGRREEAIRRTRARERRRADQEGRRIKAERTERESHLGRPSNERGPGAEFGTRPPRPGRPVQHVSGKRASGHFGSENRRFQARRDSRR